MVSRHIMLTGIGLLFIAGLSAGLWNARQERLPAPDGGSDIPPTITVAPGRFSYRLPGEFNRNNRPIDAPLSEVRFRQPLVVMKHLVSEEDYQRCVRAGNCKPLSQPGMARKQYPVTGTSWEDATAYADWFSRRTGESWRLPGDEEWAYMAGSRFKDDSLGLGESADFAQRWIARYDLEAARKLADDQQARPIGTFGENENGLADLAGSVWEWTNTCFTRSYIDGDDKPAGEPFTVCGIRVAAGQHRAYVSDFIRDARGGGCAVGIPPSNLGFRLMRDGRPSMWRGFRGRPKMEKLVY